MTSTLGFSLEKPVSMQQALEMINTGSCTSAPTIPENPLPLKECPTDPLVICPEDMDGDTRGFVMANSTAVVKAQLKPDQIRGYEAWIAVNADKMGDDTPDACISKYVRRIADLVVLEESAKRENRSFMLFGLWRTQKPGLNSYRFDPQPFQVN
eukprot:TRINITY_DN24027_c0_g1_i1.p1 TRINITY_DN24027_c0_g1~~TRINITY_DN24027_c0_g1_i1.p1  ORF type:complete len:179 (-),score=7.67 TRINITY_DN24027_c0_g1_i1:100-561(-)